ncbi:MAG: hypothetical protein MSH65_01795 [Spirochaetia bacterium]|nr:hypothetical protein [Spirochaetia bacterium]
MFSKKTLAMCAGLCISSVPVVAGGEFLVSVYADLTKPIGEAHNMQYGIGGGLKATYRPIRFLNLYAQGEYLSMALPGVSPVSILQGELGTGFHLDFADRLALDLNIDAGLYNAKATSSASGITAGGSLTFTYKISPSIYADVTATARHYSGKPSPLMMINAGLAPGLTFNISEIINKKTKLQIGLTELNPVFPVLYSWYENNSFGKIEITNKEDSSITDVTVSFFQPQYMAHAKECATFKRIKCDETVSVDLYAFFNEQMLELREKTDTSSYIIVNYSRLGKKLSQSYALDVPVYGRNNMSWDDDRRAAVFVSSKDPAAMQFAKYTASIVRDNLCIDVPVNIQYAIGIFQALNEFGLNYVVDPSSAFEDNVGTSSIDFLQFPYQTLMYRGGDCDDLSILVCSLFEAVGIDTAFITVPGHIFMAFDSGLTPEQAKTIFKNRSEYIVDDSKVWMPLEITLSDEGFYRACRYGAREWNAAEAKGAAALYKMHDSWKIYQPISVPGASAFFNIPESEIITVAFQRGLDEWKRGELRNSPLNQQYQFVILNEDDEEETQVVIKGNPLSEKSLNDILALGNKAVALVPPGVREETSEKDPDGKAGDGDDDDDFDFDFDDELIENLIPLDFAIATLQTDVPVKQSENTETETETETTEAVQEITEAETENTETVQEITEAAPENIEAAPEDTAPAPELTVYEPELTVVEPVETTTDEPAPATKVAIPTDNDYTFETTDSLLAEMEKVVSTGSTTEGTSSISERTFSTTTDTSLSNAEEKTPAPETENTVLSDNDYSFETNDSLLAEKNKTLPDTTRNIIIISSVTITAAMAAGIIINRKKRKQGRGI